MSEKTPIAVRWLEERDLEEAVDSEVRNYEGYIDPDFGVPGLPPWAWTEEDFMACIRQYKSKNRGTQDTRAVVAEVTVPVPDETGLVVEHAWVCGSLLYEIHKDHYHVLLLSAHPDSESDDVRTALLGWFAPRMTASEERKKLTMRVPDGDYRTLKFLKQQGWRVKLVSNRTEADHWLCEFHVPEQCELQSAA